MKWTKEFIYNGKHYEVSVDDRRTCCENCDKCPYVQVIGDDNFLEVCGKTGEIL